MWYRQSLAIGRSEGIIQCTYAIIYDANGNKLFALQRKNFDVSENIKNFGSSNGNIAVNTGGGREGIIAWFVDKRVGDDYADTAYITFDMPLVIAKEYSQDKLVPVTLDYNAIDYIKSTLASARKVKMPIVYMTLEDGSNEIIYKGNVKYMPADVREGVKSGKYKQTVIDDYDPRWLALSKKLNDVDTFYVKPAAFDWQPTDLSNINASYQDRVAAAKKKLDQAKALLLASGLTLTM